MSGDLASSVVELVADLFGVPAAELTPDSSPETIEGWDSIEHLNLVLALEQRFGLFFSPEEIATLGSVGAIVDAVAARR